MRSCAFDGYHPALIGAFFVCATVSCIIIQHPLFQVTGMLAALCLYVSMRGAKALSLVWKLLLLFIAISAINPLFNTGGNDVLFHLFERPYTLQALAYGASTGLMFVTIVLWFASFSRLITSDKFTYLFGSTVPSLTMLLTTVLRFIPSYFRKAREISQARSCIGKSISSGSLAHRVHDGADVLSGLTAWSLEGSVITADSMRCRGYGLGKRSSYASYSFGTRDLLLAIFLLVTFGMACTCLFIDSPYVSYMPSIVVSPFDALATLALVSYVAFSFAPAFLNMGGELSWRISVSRT